MIYLNAPAASTQLAEDNKCGPHEMEHLVMSLGGLQRYGEMREVWRSSGGSKVQCALSCTKGQVDELALAFRLGFRGGASCFALPRGCGGERFRRARQAQAHAHTTTVMMSEFWSTVVGDISPSILRLLH